MSLTVLSLGGSLICPKDIDVGFVGRFVALISGRARTGVRFTIFCGGGRLARDYIEAAGRLNGLTDVQKDWIGIEATRMNAVLVRSAFDEGLVHEKVVQDPRTLPKTKRPVVVCMGWKPGWSTDYDAVLMARAAKAGRVINVSDITHVFDKDPGKHKDAKPLECLSWKDYRALVGEKWRPGLSAPFGPIASKKAQEEGIEVVVVGPDLENLGLLLDGKRFEGTIIS